MENSHRLSNPILGGKIWTLNENGGDDDDEEEEDGRFHLYSPGGFLCYDGGLGLMVYEIHFEKFKLSYLLTTWALFSVEKGMIV